MSDIDHDYDIHTDVKYPHRDADDRGATVTVTGD